MGILDFLKTNNAEQVTDPVCGMRVSKKDTKFSFEYEGKTYYFCSEQCLDMFKAEPKGYAVK